MDPAREEGLGEYNRRHRRLELLDVSTAKPYRENCKLWGKGFLRLHSANRLQSLGTPDCANMVMMASIKPTHTASHITKTVAIVLAAGSWCLLLLMYTTSNTTPE